MYVFFVLGIVLAVGSVYTLFYKLQERLNTEKIAIDDAKGYLLIASIVIAFVLSAVAFFAGQGFGFQQQEESASMMALSLLINIMAILLTLIFGMLKLKEPEQY